jgi:hypothetical protein
MIIIQLIFISTFPRHDLHTTQITSTWAALQKVGSKRTTHNLRNNEMGQVTLFCPFYFINVYQLCKGFHCDISTHAYDVLWLCWSLVLLFIISPTTPIIQYYWVFIYPCNVLLSFSPPLIRARWFLCTLNLKNPHYLMCLNVTCVNSFAIIQQWD